MIERCEDCGRPVATDDDWQANGEHECDGDACTFGEDICWGPDANCEPASPAELRERIAVLESEIASLRAQHRPTVEDVIGRGITVTCVACWLVVNGWTKPLPDEYPWAYRGPCGELRPFATIDLGANARALYGGLRGIVLGVALHHGRDPWDVLDEMAAIEVPS